MQGPAMPDYAAFRELSPTTLADLLTRDRVMDIGIRPLWQEMPRVAGPAYPVRCPAGDHLMLHAAIYRAAPGSVIVVESGDMNYALAGGNVCAVAQRRGIAAFVLDGLIRDLAESRARRFPIFGRGVIPIPGAKEKLGTLNEKVHCGGVAVAAGDVVVADEEGIVVVPKAAAAELLVSAQKRAKKDAGQSLDEWEAAHRARIDEILRKKGFAG
jgi:4-hydroxy-4-methyl-2-oxoglutarate aldolase